MMTTSHLRENTPSSNPDGNITNSTSVNPSSSLNPPTTILHNQQSYNIKHPLQYPWRFSIKLGKILGSSSKENWESAVQEATLFDTIEDFWCLYNNYVKSVDGMPEGSDYFFFKATVQPQWEDVQNVGQISINISGSSDRGERGGSGRRIDPALIDKVILYIWLSLIGCQLENHQDINGFVFSKRGRGDRFQLWIKSAQSSVHENIK
jgi:translation initiation factor 4E